MLSIDDSGNSRYSPLTQAKLYPIPLLVGELNEFYPAMFDYLDTHYSTNNIYISYMHREKAADAETSHISPRSRSHYASRICHDSRGDGENFVIPHHVS